MSDGYLTGVDFDQEARDMNRVCVCGREGERDRKGNRRMAMYRWQLGVQGSNSFFDLTRTLHSNRLPCSDSGDTRSFATITCYSSYLPSIIYSREHTFTNLYHKS